MDHYNIALWKIPNFEFRGFSPLFCCEILIIIFHIFKQRAPIGENVVSLQWAQVSYIKFWEIEYRAILMNAFLLKLEFINNILVIWIKMVDKFTIYVHVPVPELVFQHYKPVYDYVWTSVLVTKWNSFTTKLIYHSNSISFKLLGRS